METKLDYKDPRLMLSCRKQTTHFWKRYTSFTDYYRWCLLAHNSAKRELLPQHTTGWNPMKLTHSLQRQTLGANKWASEPTNNRSGAYERSKQYRASIPESSAMERACELADGPVLLLQHTQGLIERANKCHWAREGALRSKWTIELELGNKPRGLIEQMALL